MKQGQRKSNLRRLNLRSIGPIGLAIAIMATILLFPYPRLSSNEAFGAMMGAFVAFMFFQLSSFIEKVTERNRKHYNSLVRLARQGNDALSVLGQDKYFLENFRKHLSIKQPEGAVTISWNRPSHFEPDPQHFDDLLDIDLINDLYSYYVDFQKLNDDLSTISEQYRSYYTWFIEDRINAAEYGHNTEKLIQNLAIIDNFISDLEERTIKLMARVMEQTSIDRPLSVRLRNLFTYTKGEKIKQEAVERRTTELREQLRQSKAINRNKIDEILDS